MKNLKLIVAFVSFFVLLSSCSDYNQVVKGGDYARKFELANELYENEEYFRCIALYEQIYTHMPKTGEGELAYYRLGKSYYEEEDYYMGGYYLGAFVQRFPYSNKAEEALFLTALCSVKNSPQYSLDQQDTEVAINELQQFVNRYPNSSLVDSCNRTMDRLRMKLEQKDFEAVELYARTQNYRAAVTAAISFLEDYPRSQKKERVTYLMVKNSCFLAENSVEDKKKQRIEESIERYRNFVVDFPKSSFLKELGSLTEGLSKEL
jgi:outer membrane protein assembly factor BamD